MTEVTFKQDNTARKLSGTLKDEDGAIDVSNASVELYMEDRKGNVEIDGASVTVTDGSNGKVEYDFQDGDLDSPGIKRAEFFVTYSDGDERIPNDGYVTVEVEPKLGGSS